ncbi:Rieske 2Fe-2S domain-containing protein [bacterium]|nr:Rieske 2Fe-2S domain-containing protein [bacterium]
MPDSVPMNDASAPLEDPQEGMSRRAFVAMGTALVGAVYGAAIGYPVYRYLSTPARRAASAAAVTQVDLPGADKLEIGSAMMFKFGTKPALLIHHKDDTWVALDAVCTHLGCTVQFEPEQDRIYCACHGGVYDPRTGENVAGPPPKPLTKFNVEVSDGQVVVRRA